MVFPKFNNTLPLYNIPVSSLTDVHKQAISGIPQNLVPDDYVRVTVRNDPGKDTFSLRLFERSGI